MASRKVREKLRERRMEFDRKVAESRKKHEIKEAEDTAEKDTKKKTAKKNTRKSTKK